MSEISDLLAREWSNKSQAMERSPSIFASVRLNIKKIPVSGRDLLFLEEAFSYDLSHPYQVKILEIADNRVKTYKLENPKLFFNASRYPSKFAELDPAYFLYSLGCDLSLKREGTGWRGQSESMNCIAYHKDTPTYAQSDFYVDKSCLLSLDRGFSILTNDQIWGSRFGHLHFQPFPV